MAKMKSTLFSVIRGSIAGTTYTANAFAAIVARVRTVPVNPSTVYQQAIRASFIQAKSFWADATQTVRDGWNAWAATVTFTGPLGTYRVPGRQLFIGIQALRLYWAQRGVVFGTGTTAPPIRPGLLNTPIIVQTAPTTGVGYKLTLTFSTTELLIAVTTRSSAKDVTRVFWQGPFDSTTLVSVTQTLITDPIVIERTDLTLGMVYFEHIRLICKSAPFRESQELVVRATARANL